MLYSIIRSLKFPSFPIFLIFFSNNMLGQKGKKRKEIYRKCEYPQNRIEHCGKSLVYVDVHVIVASSTIRGTTAILYLLKRMRRKQLSREDSPCVHFGTRWKLQWMGYVKSSTYRGGYRISERGGSG